MDHQLAEFAAQRHGVFGFADAAALGFTRRQARRRVATGRWTRVAEDVFHLDGAPVTWRSELLAACRAAGSEALASHRAAARLWQLDGVEREAIEITIAKSTRRRGPTVAVVHECRTLLPVDRRIVDEIPVTAPELTLLQLGAVARPEEVEHALDDALRRGLTTNPRLRWRLQVLGRRGRNGTAVLRALLDARDEESAVPESVLERKFVQVLRAHDVELPVLQWELRAGSRLVARVDAAWPERRLVVELDGERFHGGRGRRQADLRRQNELTAMGLTVLRFTWTDVVQFPERTVTTLRSVLAGHDDRFGLSGPPDTGAGKGHGDGTAGAAAS